MKTNLRIRQSVKRKILAVAFGLAMLLGILGMQPTAKQADVAVAKVEQAEEIAQWPWSEDNFWWMQGNYWSG